MFLKIEKDASNNYLVEIYTEKNKRIRCYFDDEKDALCYVFNFLKELINFKELKESNYE